MTDDSRESLADQLESALPELPDGEYAVVEIMGHRTLVGRITEVQRFGANMMMVEPILRGRFIEPVYINGGSVYQLTPLPKENALKYAPKEDWHLPDPVRAALPVALLAPPADRDDVPFMEGRDD